MTGNHKSHNKTDVIQDIDSVPSNVQSASQETSLYVFDVNTIHLAPDIHEHFMIYNRLRNTAYIFMHNLNNPETTVTNCMSGTTHTDVITAQF